MIASRSGILTYTFLKVSMISLFNSVSASFLFCVTLFGKGNDMLGSDFQLLLFLNGSTSSLSISAKSDFSAKTAFASKPSFPAESEISA